MGNCGGKDVMVETIDESSKDLENLPKSLTRSAIRKSLRQVNLSNNSLKEIDEKFWLNTNLEEIILKGNKKFSAIPDQVVTLSKLSKLDISETGLKKINDFLWSLKSLTYLDVSKTAIISLGKPSSTSLVYLDISFNKLTELPEEIGTLTSLQIFKANNNKFKKVPKSIGQCSKLKELYIQENELTYLPNVENIKKLTKLKISDKQEEDNVSLFETNFEDEIVLSCTYFNCPTLAPIAPKRIDSLSTKKSDSEESETVTFATEEPLVEKSPIVHVEIEEKIEVTAGKTIEADVEKSSEIKIEVEKSEEKTLEAKIEKSEESFVMVEATEIESSKTETKETTVITTTITSDEKIISESEKTTKEIEQTDEIKKVDEIEIVDEIKKVDEIEKVVAIENVIENEKVDEIKKVDKIEKVDEIEKINKIEKHEDVEVEEEEIKKSSRSSSLVVEVCAIESAENVDDIVNDIILEENTVEKPEEANVELVVQTTTNVSENYEESYVEAGTVVYEQTTVTTTKTVTDHEGNSHEEKHVEFSEEVKTIPQNEESEEEAVDYAKENDEKFKPPLSPKPIRFVAEASFLNSSKGESEDEIEEERKLREKEEHASEIIRARGVGSVRRSMQMFADVAVQDSKPKPSTQKMTRRMSSREHYQTDQLSQTGSGVVRVAVPLPENFKEIQLKSTAQKTSTPVKTGRLDPIFGDESGNTPIKKSQAEVIPVILPTTEKIQKLDKKIISESLTPSFADIKIDLEDEITEKIEKVKDEKLEQKLNGQRLSMTITQTLKDIDFESDPKEILAKASKSKDASLGLSILTAEEFDETKQLSPKTIIIENILEVSSTKWSGDKPKPGDVLESIDGTKCDNSNINSLLSDAGNLIQLKFLRYPSAFTGYM